MENIDKGIVYHTGDMSSVISNKMLNSVNSQDTFYWIFQCLKECDFKTGMSQEPFVPKEQKYKWGFKMSLKLMVLQIWEYNTKNKVKNKIQTSWTD